MKPLDGRPRPLHRFPVVTCAAAAAAVFMLGSPPSAPGIDPPDCPSFESLCLQAERSGGIDLKAGTAELEGNVVGLLRRHELAFQAQSLKAFRNDANEWVRLELDREVELEQPGIRASADHANVENDSGRVLLIGSVKLEEPPAFVSGERILLERNPRRSTIDGNPQAPLRMRYEGRAPEAPAPTEDIAPGPSVGEDRGADTIIVTALHATLEQEVRKVHYRGDVEMRRVELGWQVWAQEIELEFSRDNRLTSFRAVGQVKIEQPGRLLEGDEARSQNGMQTLLLIGNAHARQEGQFDLTSERLEVYTDANKGLVQSDDRQQPIRLTLEVGTPTPYALDPERVSLLRGQGIPEPTLAKLAALHGRTFSGRAAFVEALRPLLSAAEAELYLEPIADGAK